MALETHYSLMNSLNTKNIAIIPYDVIITGDLDFHVYNKSDVETPRFCSILDTQGLTQHVNGASQKGSLTLALVISEESSSIIIGTLSVCNILSQ